MPATGLHSREQSSTWSCLGRRHIGTTVIGGRSYAYRHDQLVDGRLYAYRHDRLVDGSQAYRRDSCQIQVAVRCERRVVIVVERRARLSVGR